jgi:type IV fimbrial biogenesis protein FimT
MRANHHDLPAIMLAQPRAPARRQGGVTLVEVMATTAISAIILGAAAPSYVESIRVNRARSAVQQMTGLLNDARSEATRRNTSVLVCPSSNGTSCMSSLQPSSWAGRTIVCYDVDDDGACDTSTLNAPNPIRVRAAVDSKVTLAGPAAVVRFNGMGATASSVSFSVGADNGQSSASINVATTGAVRVN